MLKVAARFGLSDLANYTIRSLEAAPAVPEPQSHPLEIAVRYGHKDLVTLLLRNSTQFDSEFCLAAGCGRNDIFEVIIKANAGIVSLE